MLRLFLDTSNQYLFIALLKDEDEIFKVTQLGNNNHSELLVDSLKNNFSKTTYTPDDIDEIYVGRGPGSYTGVRVSCTIAKVMAYTKNIPLYSFSSLDLLLSSYLENKDNNTYILTMDARRGFTYAKVVSINNQQIQILLDETYIEKDKLLNDYKGLIITTDDTAYNCNALLKKNLYKKETNVHAFVPKYLRSGVNND